MPCVGETPLAIVGLVYRCSAVLVCLRCCAGGLWSPVNLQEKMALSDEQRRRILDARQTLLHSMDAIVQRRREIIASLQVRRR